MRARTLFFSLSLSLSLSLFLSLPLSLSFSLLDPPVIILGDHIARVLTNSGIQRQRENQPPSGVNSLLFSLTVTVVCLSSALSLARSFSFSLALPLCTFSLSVCLCLPFSLLPALSLATPFGYLAAIPAILVHRTRGRLAGVAMTAVASRAPVHTQPAHRRPTMHC